MLVFVSSAKGSGCVTPSVKPYYSQDNQLCLYLCLCLPRAGNVWHMVSNLITQNQLYFFYLYLCLCSTAVLTCQYLTCRLWFYYCISIVSVLPLQQPIVPPSHCYHFQNFHITKCLFKRSLSTQFLKWCALCLHLSFMLCFSPCHRVPHLITTLQHQRPPGSNTVRVLSQCVQW